MSGIGFFLGLFCLSTEYRKVFDYHLDANECKFQPHFPSNLSDLKELHKAILSKPKGFPLEEDPVHKVQACVRKAASYLLLLLFFTFFGNTGALEEEESNSQVMP